MGKQTTGVKTSERKVDKDQGLLRGQQERGARIKALREKSGLTTEQFAVACGVTEVTQYNYERAERVPDANYLAELYYQFAVDLGPLITGAPRAKATKLSAAAEEMLFKYEALPAKLKKTVDDVLLMAWLAYQARRAEHEPKP